MREVGTHGGTADTHEHNDLSGRVKLNTMNTGTQDLFKIKQET